jgi:hypothetical protein
MKFIYSISSDTFHAKLLFNLCSIGIGIEPKSHFSRR